MFYLQETWSLSVKLPYEKEKLGKWDGSLVLTIGANEKQEKDGDAPAGPKKSGQIVLVDTAVEGPWWMKV